MPSLPKLESPWASQVPADDLDLRRRPDPYGLPGLTHASGGGGGGGGKAACAAYSLASSKCAKRGGVCCVCHCSQSQLPVHGWGCADPDPGPCPIDEGAVVVTDRIEGCDQRGCGNRSYFCCADAKNPPRYCCCTKGVLSQVSAPNQCKGEIYGITYDGTNPCGSAAINSCLTDPCKSWRQPVQTLSCGITRYTYKPECECTFQCGVHHTSPKYGNQLVLTTWGANAPEDCAKYAGVHDPLAILYSTPCFGTTRNPSYDPWRYVYNYQCKNKPAGSCCQKQAHPSACQHCLPPPEPGQNCQCVTRSLSCCCKPDGTVTPVEDFKNIPQGYGQHDTPSGKTLCEKSGGVLLGPADPTTNSCQGWNAVCLKKQSKKYRCCCINGVKVPLEDGPGAPTTCAKWNGVLDPPSKSYAAIDPSLPVYGCSGACPTKLCCVKPTTVFPDLAGTGFTKQLGKPSSFVPTESKPYTRTSVGECEFFGGIPLPGDCPALDVFLRLPDIPRICCHLGDQQYEMEDTRDNVFWCVNSKSSTGKPGAVTKGRCPQPSPRFSGCDVPCIEGLLHAEDCTIVLLDRIDAVFPLQNSGKNIDVFPKAIFKHIFGVDDFWSIRKVIARLRAAKKQLAPRSVAYCCDYSCKETEVMYARPHSFGTLAAAIREPIHPCCNHPIFRSEFDKNTDPHFRPETAATTLVHEINHLLFGSDASNDGTKRQTDCAGSSQMRLENSYCHEHLILLLAGACP